MVDERLFDRPGGPRPRVPHPCGSARAQARRAHARARRVARARPRRIQIGRRRADRCLRLPVGGGEGPAGRRRPARKEVDADVRPVETNDDSVTIRQARARRGGRGFRRHQRAALAAIPVPSRGVRPVRRRGACRPSRRRECIRVSPDSARCAPHRPAGVRHLPAEDRRQPRRGWDHPRIRVPNQRQRCAPVDGRGGMGLAVMPLLGVDVADPAIQICRLEPPIAPRRIGLVSGTTPLRSSSASWRSPSTSAEKPSNPWRR